MSAQEKRKGDYLKRFPAGWVYTIEFEDGSSVEVAEADLVLLSRSEPEEPASKDPK